MVCTSWLFAPSLKHVLPDNSEYFLDNLHPNALGSEVYGRNLVLAIQEAGF